VKDSISGTICGLQPSVEIISCMFLCLMPSWRLESIKSGVKNVIYSLASQGHVSSLPWLPSVL